MLDKEKLKQQLSEEEFHVTQEKGTEVPFSGKYVNHHEEGTYACKVCGAPLFASGTKFDSGTGWPSFDQALPNAVVYHEDSSHGMNRTEVTCANCGSHLGHKFNDGPADTTGERFCMNSCSLDFKGENK